MPEPLSVDNSIFVRYKESGDIKLRNEIALRYSNVVKYIAISMRNMYIKYADVDDIINEGMIALMAAIDQFDLSKNVKFETYASIKVRGAVIDYIRKQDWVPRQLRRFSKELDIAYSELYMKLDRNPTNSELAEYMDMTEDKFNKSMADVSGTVTLSFEQLLYEDNFDFGDETLPDGVSTTEQRLYGQELQSIIAQAIDTLNEKERLVISLYYYERLKFSDIAKVLNLSDSRVSQIHTKAITTLKNKLDSYVRS
ncbi:MAG TPA: FliA/WhiG family RNA polymerase sigma factor [Oscillospiraceae bacterium]|nr:FliA/WhiG family RNA polymerase sigma factor [Oscillospiraceae bacterium]